MTQSAYENYQEDSVKLGFSTSAGVQGTFYSVQADASLDINRDATDAFEEAIKTGSFTESYRGGTGFIKGDYQMWAETLEENYATVSGTKSRLEPITELLTPVNFPGLDPGVQKTAEAFVQRLCTAGGSNLGHEECTPFPVDPLMFTRHTSAGITSVAWARDGGNVTTGDTTTGSCRRGMCSPVRRGSRRSSVRQPPWPRLRTARTERASPWASKIPLSRSGFWTQRRGSSRSRCGGRTWGGRARGALWRTAQMAGTSPPSRKISGTTEDIRIILMSRSGTSLIQPPRHPASSRAGFDLVPRG